MNKREVVNAVLEILETSEKGARKTVERVYDRLHKNYIDGEDLIWAIVGELR